MESSVSVIIDPSRQDDSFETVEYAERFASEIPHTTLLRIPDAGHIPTENAPHQIACALIDFFTA
jgi:pimeloyl-ACP methyl ester carboxylesterase